MMTEPHYHKQPHTQDPNQKPPEEDAPLAQGHSEEQREDVREAISEHKDQVEAERDVDDVGPRAAGDHAGSEGSDGSEVPDGTVDEVKEWVGDDPDRAQQALDAENAKSSPRSSLVAHLESIANG